MSTVRLEVDWHEMIRGCNEYFVGKGGSSDFMSEFLFQRELAS